MMRGWIIAMALVAAPAGAGTREGLDAWAAGDFPRAVNELRPPAQAGEAEAQFALGEAYRLGRGVAPDPAAAIGWYRRASAQGHSRAADALGLMLFAQGQRQEAMPLLVKAAERGEPRALYLVATAHFNGDYAAKDWPRAYAMMTRAADAGIIQARQSLATMDRYLFPGDKAKAQALIAAQRRESSVPAPASPPAAPVKVAAAPKPTPKPVPPKPAPPKPAPPPVPTKTAPVADAAPAARGAWKAQLGAFASAERAEAAWTRLAGKVAGLGSVDHQIVAAGTVRRLQATGLAGRDAANGLCGKVKAAGGDCLVIAP